MEIEADLIERIVKWAHGEPSVVKVWVFGSRIKGTARLDSDIDVAVEVRWVSDLGYCESPLCIWMDLKPRLEASLAPLLPYKLDLQWYGGATETPNMDKYLNEISIQIYPAT